VRCQYLTSPNYHQGNDQRQQKKLNNHVHLAAKYSGGLVRTRSCGCLSRRSSTRPDQSPMRLKIAFSCGTFTADPEPDELPAPRGGRVAGEAPAWGALRRHAALSRKMLTPRREEDAQHVAKTTHDPSCRLLPAPPLTVTRRPYCHEAAISPANPLSSTIVALNAWSQFAIWSM
jgi:hypothetical protein